MPTIKAKAIASGTSASATVRPESSSVLIFVSFLLIRLNTGGGSLGKKASRRNCWQVNILTKPSSESLIGYFLCKVCYFGGLRLILMGRKMRLFFVQNSIGSGILAHISQKSS